MKTIKFFLATAIALTAIALTTVTVNAQELPPHIPIHAFYDHDSDGIFNPDIDDHAPFVETTCRSENAGFSNWTRIHGAGYIRLDLTKGPLECLINTGDRNLDMAWAAEIHVIDTSNTAQGRTIDIPLWENTEAHTTVNPIVSFLPLAFSELPAELGTPISDHN